LTNGTKGKKLGKGGGKGTSRKQKPVKKLGGKKPAASTGKVMGKENLKKKKK